jgi:hypothetical protein
MFIPGGGRDFVILYSIQTGTGSSGLLPNECRNFYLWRHIATYLPVVKRLNSWRYTSKCPCIIIKINYNLNLNFSGPEYPFPILNKRLRVILKYYFASWGNNMCFSTFKLKEMPYKCVLLYCALFCFSCGCWRTRSGL